MLKADQCIVYPPLYRERFNSHRRRRNRIHKIKVVTPSCQRGLTCLMPTRCGLESATGFRSALDNVIVRS